MGVSAGGGKKGLMRNRAQMQQAGVPPGAALAPRGFLFISLGPHFRTWVLF